MFICVASSGIIHTNVFNAPCQQNPEFAAFLGTETQVESNRMLADVGCYVLKKTCLRAVVYFLGSESGQRMADAIAVVKANERQVSNFVKHHVIPDNPRLEDAPPNG